MAPPAGKKRLEDFQPVSVASVYLHLPSRQLPEQHWLFFEQLETLGLQLKQPLVLNRHVDVLQDRDPPAKPRARVLPLKKRG